MARRKQIRRHIRTSLGQKRSTWYHVPKTPQDTQTASEEIRRKRKCTEKQDSKTTYMQEKFFSTQLQDWFYKKYVECDYVE